MNFKKGISRAEGEKSYWDLVKKNLADNIKAGDEEGEDVPAGKEKDLPVKNLERLVDFYNTLDRIVLGDRDLGSIIRIISGHLKKIFQSMYVELFLIKGDYLEYQHITDPSWMLEMTHRLLRISPVLGMKVELFEGSYFKELVDGGRPREIMGRRNLLRSLRDFLPPSSRHNVFLREHFAEPALLFFGYRYVFQVPLVVNQRMIGYFSFLQRSRFNERTRMEIMLLSDKIGGLIMLKKREEELPDLYSSMNKGFALFETITNSRKEIVDFILIRLNRWLETALDVRSEDYYRKSINCLLGEKGRALFSLFESVTETDSAKTVEMEFPCRERVMRLFVYRRPNGRVALQMDDITEEKNRERERDYAACHDVMTGLLNRATFESYARQELQSARRNKNCFALLFIDLDHFKPVNDLYGHDAGDRLLVAAARRIEEAMRDDDIAARFGGDEFVVLGRGVDSPAKGRIFVNKIQSALSGPVSLGPEMTAVLSASVGIALYPSDGEDYETLCAVSDRRMYDFKNDKKKSLKRGMIRRVV